MSLKSLTLLSALLAAVTVCGQSAYDYSRLKGEPLDRGVVAVRQDADTVALSWRYLSADPMDQAFDIYRDGRKINIKPLTDKTFFKDPYGGKAEAHYEVRALKGKKQGARTPCPPRLRTDT